MIVADYDRGSLFVGFAAPDGIEIDQANLSATGRVGRPTVLLINRVRSGTRSLAAARATLYELQLSVLRTAIPQREALAFIFGIRASAIVTALYHDVVDEFRQAIGEVAA